MLPYQQFLAQVPETYKQSNIETFEQIHDACEMYIQVQEDMKVEMFNKKLRQFQKLVDNDGVELESEPLTEDQLYQDTISQLKLEKVSLIKQNAAYKLQLPAVSNRSKLQQILRQFSGDIKSITSQLKQDIKKPLTIPEITLQRFGAENFSAVNQKLLEKVAQLEIERNQNEEASTISQPVQYQPRGLSASQPSSFQLISVEMERAELQEKLEAVKRVNHKLLSENLILKHKLEYQNMPTFDNFTCQTEDFFDGEVMQLQTQNNMQSQQIFQLLGCSGNKKEAIQVQLDNLSQQNIDLIRENLNFKQRISSVHGTLNQSTQTVTATATHDQYIQTLTIRTKTKGNTCCTVPEEE